MALLVERTFILAVATAESNRQAAKAAAFAAYAFVPANLPTYIAAILAADVAYVTAVNAAASASGLDLGTLGQSGPIPTVSASLST
jgi:hypothetical protein